MFKIITRYQSWVYFWDCVESDIPQAQQSLFILNGITRKDLQIVFSKSNIQNSITFNTWLIHTKETIREVYSLFDGIKLKIGINAQIFVIISSDLSYDVVQIIGTCLHKVEFKVRPSIIVT